MTEKFLRIPLKFPILGNGRIVCHSRQELKNISVLIQIFVEHPECLGHVNGGGMAKK
jgi:hypothetical protein